MRLKELALALKKQEHDTQLLHLKTLEISADCYVNSVLVTISTRIQLGHSIQERLREHGG